jgi:hypothetical protein
VIRIDKVAPSRVSNTPANNANGVVSTTPIRITFSEAIVPGSNYNGITVKQGTTPLTFIPNVLPGNVLTLTPSSAWPKPNAQISVVVPAGAVMDVAGNPTASATSFNFRTGSQ